MAPVTAERAAEIAANTIERIQRGVGKGKSFDGFNQLCVVIRPTTILFKYVLSYEKDLAVNPTGIEHHNTINEI